MKYTIHRKKGPGIKSRVQILSALVLTLVVLTTFSCSNVFETPLEETPSAGSQPDTKKDPELIKQKKGGITITLVQPENVQQSAGSRTLLPDIDLTNLTSISLTGTKSGETTVHTLGSWSSTSQLSGLIALEAGVWNLVLTASNSSFVFSDTKNVTIAIGQSQNVSFVLSASSTGGGINFKINFSDNAQKLEYNLYRYESGSFTSIENNPDATINTEPSGRCFTYVRNSSNPIQAGTYKLLLKFYGDSAGTILINTYSEIINVKAGFISRSTEKTINLNQMHSISYKTEAGNDLDPSEYTIKDSLGNITTLPYNYSLYSGEVSLPLLEKAGYIFDGWFTADELGNLSSSPVSAISASESGNKEYRAKFVIEMKEGAAFHTAINNWNGAERMMPSTTPPDPSITITHYLDTGTNVPVWYDTTDSCIKYYAAGYTDGTSKLYLRPDSNGMFNGSWKFKVLDLTPFDTSRVTDMSNMFKGCSNLETVYVSSAFTTGAVNTSTDMFANCSIKLKGENGFTWNSTNDKTATYAKINTPTQHGYFWNAPSSPVYFITYVLNEGDNALTNPGSYTSEILPITLTDPSGQNSTGDSFQFEGWYTSSTFAAGTQVSTISDTSYGSFTLYAKWKVPYRVKHMQQNTTGSNYTEQTSDQQVLYGYAGANTTAGTKTYTGFNTPTVAQVAIEADGSTVVNIYYDRLTYTVTYNDGDDSVDIPVPSAQTGIRYGATFTPTYTGVTRDGYDFGGWSDGTWGYTSSGPHTTLTMPNNDVTLMAQWNIIPYTLTLNKNDNNDTSYPATWTGTGPTGFTISQLPYTLPTASSTNRLTRNGYNFTGWYTAASGGEQVTQITEIGDKTYYAHWEAVPYGLTLVENDNNDATYPASWTGTEPNSFNVTQLPYTLPTASSTNRLTRTGYIFNGWYTAATGGTQITEITTLGAKTYYAHWAPVPYTLDLQENDNAAFTASWTGTEPNGFNVTQLPYTLPTASSSPKLTRTGYTFAGWYTAATGGSQVSTISTLGDKTYYAHWDPVTYTLNLQESGTSTYPVSWIGTEPEEFNTNQLPYTLPTASSSNRVTRTGYTFAGWYTASTGGTKVTSIPAEASSAADKTYYAQWTPVTYTLTLQENGTSTYPVSWTGTEPNEFNTNQLPYTLPTASSSNRVTRTGYTFDGWYTASTGGTKVTQIPASGTSNQTYYAQWTPVTYTLNLLKNDTTTYPASWTGTEPTSFNTNQLPYTLPTATSANKLTRNGYTFNGWYTASSGGTKVTAIPTSGTSNQNYYAQWTLNTYTITYNFSNGGSWVSGYTAPNEFTITSGAVTLPTADKVNRTNYVFTGWYDAATNGTKYTAVPANSYGNKTYYAQWASAVVTANSVDAAITKIQNAPSGQTVKITCSLTNDQLASIVAAIKDKTTPVGLDLSQTGMTEITTSFFGVGYLSNIILPDALTTIGSGVFNGCSSYVPAYPITIPANCTNVSPGSTRSLCGNFSAINVDSANTAFVSVDGVLYQTTGISMTPYQLLVYPKGKETVDSFTIDCNDVYGDALSGRSNVKNVVLTDNVISIGNSAFANSGIQSVDIYPRSLGMSPLNIGYGVFNQCNQLTSIRFHGTKLQWESVNRNASWLGGTRPPVLYVECDDGPSTVGFE